MIRSNKKHSILFGDGTLDHGKFVGVDTYEDWHLVPSSRPAIASPGVETKFVTIPGRDGSLDLSEFLRNGRPAYGDRSGSFDFYVENGWDENANPEEFWMTLYPRIVNTLHGKKFKMVLNEDDPDYYWEGRFTVDKYDPGDGYHSKVTISYAVAPFKRRIHKTLERTVWDNFNFEKDYDYDPWGLDRVVGGWDGIIWGDGYPFQLEVTGLSGNVNVTFGGETVQVASGTTRKIGHAEYGPNQILTSGSGTVSINWRGGSL